MYNYSFSESKKYNKIHIENDQEVRSLNLAPLIVEGGSVFKKPAFFLQSVVVGQSGIPREGMIQYRQGDFSGYDGTSWVSFTKESVWMHEDNILHTNGNRVGINKINPRKALEVGGDVLIEKKLQVLDELKVDAGVILGENLGKKKPGMIRFYEKSFEGYDGEKWVKFSGNEKQMEVVIPEKVDLNSVDKIRLLNCPLAFSNGINDTHFYFHPEKKEFRLEKLLTGSYEGIKMENLSLGTLNVHGEIIFPQEGKRNTIKNLSDPVTNDEVATKKYVDQVAQGLQNYFVTDFLFLEGDGTVEDNDILLSRDIGNIQESKYLFILTKSRVEYGKVINRDGNNMRLANMSGIHLPAKLCVKDGFYGQSEYFIFEKDDEINYVLINGMENLEYLSPLSKNGKEIKLNINQNLFSLNNQLNLKEHCLDETYFKPESITSNLIKPFTIEGKHLCDKSIEKRHLNNLIISAEHIQQKSIGDNHIREGSIKNHHFAPGIITEKELANECIGITTLKPSIIMQKHLTKNSVSGENIFDLSIENRHLTEKVIESWNLKEKIILGMHLSNNIIKENHLTEKLIEEKHLSDGCISRNHLREKIINKEHIGVSVISGLHLEENSIGGNHLKEQSINSRNLMPKCIMEWHIGEKVIKSNHLSEDVFNSVRLGEKVIIEMNLSDNCIGSNAIKKNAIQMQHLGMNCIDDKHIVNFSIKNTKLMDGVITENKLCDNSVTNGKIKDKSITNEKLKLSFIKIQTDPIFTCTQMVNLGDTLTIGLNQNYMVPKRRDGIVEFMSSVKFGEEGSGQRMYINMDVDITGELNYGGNKFFEIGEIRLFMERVNISKCWVKCDGRKLKRNDYPELYNILGKEEEEFSVPDLKSPENTMYAIYAVTRINL